MTHTAYDVYQHGKWLERVYYQANAFTADEVRKSLIDHDGYPPEITVHLAGQKTS
jgi:hypothetical protein